MDYSRFINRVSSSRKKNPLRVLTATMLQSHPDMVSLAAGCPNPKTFPFKSIQLTLNDGTVLTLDETKLATGLQYGSSDGQASLLCWLRDFQQIVHNPPTSWQDGLSICVTAGSQDAISKCFEMVLERGDPVIMENPTYLGALNILRPLQCRPIVVDTDEYGMVPASLRDVLSQWATSATTDMPKVIYLNPVGANPTGATMTMERKQEIYKIAQEYDLLIMEDDPYYFMQLSQDRVASFLSLDVDGRVIRFDSFSKTLSAGMRIGFMTGPTALVERIKRHMMSTVMHANTLSQMIISALVNKWGVDGFLQHANRIAEFYQSQRVAMVKSAEKWLTGLADWTIPSAGMFMWLRLKNIKDSQHLIEETAFQKQVLLVPGYAFMPTAGVPCPYFRASFSLASPEQIDKGFQRLAVAVKEHLAKNMLLPSMTNYDIRRDP